MKLTFGSSPYPTTTRPPARLSAQTTPFPNKTTQASPVLFGTISPTITIPMMLTGVTAGIFLDGLKSKLQENQLRKRTNPVNDIERNNPAIEEKAPKLNVHT
jgi:hypothetical protein